MGIYDMDDMGTGPMDPADIAEQAKRTLYRDPVPVLAAGGRPLRAARRPANGAVEACSADGGARVPLDDLDPASRDRLLDSPLLSGGTPRTVPAPPWWGS